MTAKLEFQTRDAEDLARAFHPDAEDRPVAAGKGVYSVRRNGDSGLLVWPSQQ